MYYSQLNLYCWWETIRPYLRKFKGVRNNRAWRAQAVATGAYLQNKTREHNQLLDTNQILLVYIASLLSLKAAACL